MHLCNTLVYIGTIYDDKLYFYWKLDLITPPNFLAQFRVEHKKLKTEFSPPHRDMLWMGRVNPIIICIRLKPARFANVLNMMAMNNI